MNLEYTAQKIGNLQNTYLPCSVPEYSNAGTWRNRGVETYVEQFGQAEFDRRIQSDYPMPMPLDTPRERRRLGRTLKMAKLMFGYKPLMTGRRATHMRGQGAKGMVKVVPAPDIPDHDFFRPGAEFACRIRHANASFYDDASVQVRSCSIKFADTEYDSPLDLLMNSGPTSAFWNLKTFMDFSWARVRCSEHDWEAQKKWMRNSPAGYIGTIDAVRHAPSSYTSMTYYTKIAFPFKARDGVVRYAKFRVVPCDMQQESGLLADHMQRRPWIQCREPEDGRPRDYLRQEYRERLERQGEIEYLLQVQVRDWQMASDTIEFFNMNRVWDEAQWPWRDLANIRTTQALPEDVTERMGWWLGHQPPSLGLTDAHAAVDYRSLAWARPQVYPVSRMNRSIRRKLNLQRRLPDDF